MKKETIPFYNNPKNRSIIYQIIIVGLIFFFAYYIVGNLFDNIAKRGISTGFDFLNEESGFGISQTLIEYDETSSHGKVFIVGILNTILVSVLGIFTASIIGLLIGIGRLSTNWIISKICTMYIELFRNIPVLLQILFWYNVVLASLNSPRKSIVFLESMFLNTRGLYIPKPLLQDGFIFVIISFIIAIISIIFLAKWARKRHDETGIKFPIVTVSFGIIMFSTTIVYFLSGSPIDFEYPILRGFNFVGGYNLVPELLALWLALSIYTATYIAEAVRAGIEAIDKGQSEASLSLGLSKSLMLKKVILPQALRIIIPPIINQYANLTKNSSLATAIGYPELVTIFSGTSLNQVGQAIEIILMTMAVYLIFNILVSMIMNYINAKIKIKER